MAVALEKLKLPYVHKFASENDLATRTTLEWNHRIETVLEDCKKSLVCMRKLPAVDLYASGPPCQPWSACGKNEGLDDDRGPPLLEVCHKIKNQ